MDILINFLSRFFSFFLFTDFADFWGFASCAAGCTVEWEEEQEEQGNGMLLTCPATVPSRIRSYTVGFIFCISY